MKISGVSNWLGNEETIDIAPADGDGITNMLDLAEFSKNWLVGVQ